jgi:small subunit ribosomal protein S14
MAKKSIIARAKKRTGIVERCKQLRDKLIAVVKSSTADYEARDEAMLKLQKQTRNASTTRVRRRCRQCGRPRGVYRRFGLCRIHLRETLMNGEVPGGRKSSW